MDTKTFLPKDKFIEEHSNFPKIWSDKEFWSPIRILQSPIGNCQHFSVSGFERILEKYDVRKQLSEIKKIFVYPNEKRYNVVVDVAFGFKEQIDSLFTKDEIMSESVYTSSNDNIRILYILSLKNL